MRAAIEKKATRKSAQAKFLQALLSSPRNALLTSLLQQAGVSSSPAYCLEKEGLITIKLLVIERSPLDSFEFFPSKPKPLHPEQAECLAKIHDHLDSDCFHTHLIHGITGSGKTEVYMQAMEKALKKQRSVIFLVPEIALTSQTIERLKARFREKIGIAHSRLSTGERFDLWRSALQGNVQIVVGARSAIFSPLARLGLIIIDEEHDTSYKQSQEEPCYHARDVAIMRGKLTNATVLLGSATPAFETYFHAKQGKYHFSFLGRRATSACLPQVRFVDMKKQWEKKQGLQLLSEPLIAAIKNRLANGEQILLFLNRRGYQTLQLCSHCGQTRQCDRCDVSLIFHKREGALRCHFCGFSLSPVPTVCCYCKKTGHLEYKGTGTEKIERALYALFPSIRVLRMDADTTQAKHSHDKLLKQFRSGKADVLIGTQMIAKGLHFPNVTLVGILYSDGALHLPDFRASEKLFQLLVQVAGRAGRSELPGEVLIQTCFQKHFVFDLAARSDYAAFFAKELASRKQFHFPPFTRLMKLTFTGKNAALTSSFAERFRAKLLTHLDASFTFYPVIPCGHAKINNTYRFKLVIKGAKIYSLSEQLSKLRLHFPPPRGVRILVDMDPLSMF